MSLNLRFVGCGDAFGSGGRFNTCFHLTGEAINLLIDCGASSLVAMKRLGIDRNAISTILLTHYHADHFGGVPFFMLDAQFFAKRREPLTLVGPPGLAQWYERAMECAFPGSAHAPRKFDLHLQEIAPGETLAVDGVAVRAWQAVHGGPGLIYRIEADGRAIAYTGDTEWTPDLIEAARDADLFIAEAYFRERVVATHLSLATLEAHLDDIRPRRLILTHMSDDMLNHPDRARYECAEDGMTVEIA